MFFSMIRFRLRDMPLERDEGEYAYAGQLLLEGIPPYQLAYNMKLPGTYAAYAGILTLFGQSAQAVHLGLILVNAATIANMKDGVRIINTARGELIHEADLAAALDSGKIAAAALDVLSLEPPTKDNPLPKHPKVIATPHIAASTAEAQEMVGVEIAEQVRGFLKDGIIRNAVAVANGRPLIFKFHPNEQMARAEKEVREHAPGALTFREGSAEEMIANCDVLITRYSSTVFVGLALGKETYSDLPDDDLLRLLPLQNNSAAANIADVCRRVIAQGSIQ